MQFQVSLELLHTVLISHSIATKHQSFHNENQSRRKEANDQNNMCPLKIPKGQTSRDYLGWVAMATQSVIRWFAEMMVQTGFLPTRLTKLHKRLEL